MFLHDIVVMERSDALHDILDELNITSLDDSDVEAGLQSLASDDLASAPRDHSHGRQQLGHRGCLSRIVS